MSTACTPGALPTEMFRVYEATDPFHPRPYRLALRLSGERRILDDISAGRRLITLGRVVLETCDQRLARAQSEALLS